MTKVFSGALLRTHRQAHHFSVEDLAAATGLSYGGIKKIERGDVQPSFASIVSIVAALPGIGFDDLLADNDHVGAGAA